jgi:hypothetical protein
MPTADSFNTVCCHLTCILSPHRVTATGQDPVGKRQPGGVLLLLLSELQPPCTAVCNLRHTHANIRTTESQTHGHACCSCSSPGREGAWVVEAMDEHVCPVCEVVRQNGCVALWAVGPDHANIGDGLPAPQVTY